MTEASLIMSRYIKDLMLGLVQEILLEGGSLWSIQQICGDQICVLWYGISRNPPVHSWNTPVH